MAWSIEFDPKARKELEDLPMDVAQRILVFLFERLRIQENPRQLGAPLHGKRYGNLWKYRVGDYRLICDIQDRRVTVTVVRIGHRGKVYQMTRRGSPTHRRLGCPGNAISLHSPNPKPSRVQSPMA